MVTNCVRGCFHVGAKKGLGLVAASILVSGMSSPASAGSTSSGGGEVRSDIHNPWFLKNTKIVRYCVDIDSTNFGQNNDVIREKIKNAFAYWQREFATHKPIDDPMVNPVVKLGMQEFVEVSCDRDVDLAFQFGVLHPDQIGSNSDLENPSTAIGAAVRTDYDLVDLKGKGFIYISPVSGPLALNAANLIGDRWRIGGGKILELILVHELGHVFGVPHSGGTFQTGIMDENFPGKVVSADVGLVYLRTTKIPSVLAYPMTGVKKMCSGHGFGEKVFQVLGLPREWQCLKIVYGVDAFTVQGSVTESAAFVEIGRGHFYASETPNADSYIDLFVTDKQRVFDSIPSYRQILFSYDAEEREKAGDYVQMVDGGRRQVLFHFGVNALEISGTNARGRIELNVLNLDDWDFNFQSGSLAL